MMIMNNHIGNILSIMTAELGATVSWQDQLIATCRAEPLTTGYTVLHTGTLDTVSRGLYARNSGYDRPTLSVLFKMLIHFLLGSNPLNPK